MFSHNFFSLQIQFKKHGKPLTMTENKPVYSLLSTDDRSKATLAKKIRDSEKCERRKTVNGSLDDFLTDFDRGDLLGDEESLCSRQSELSKFSIATTGMMYQRRCSITKFSLPSALTSESSISCLDEDDASFASFQTSGRSICSTSSFPEIPSECTMIDSLPIPMKRRSMIDSLPIPMKRRSTIDSLPIPMKRRSSKKKERSSRHLNSSKKLKSRDLIKKYNREPLTEEELIKASSFRKKTKNSTSSKKIGSESKKKEKSEKKLKTEKVEKVEHSEPTDAGVPKRKYKRRCSVTKYNLVPNLEAEMETEMSKPPPSHGMMGRRNSVTKYSPDIMDNVEKSPGLYGRRNSITKYSAEMGPERIPMSTAAACISLCI
jgi:hypothetical protein